MWLIELWKSGNLFATVLLATPLVFALMPFTFWLLLKAYDERKHKGNPKTKRQVTLKVMKKA